MSNKKSLEKLNNMGDGIRDSSFEKNWTQLVKEGKLHCFDAPLTSNSSDEKAPKFFELYQGQYYYVDNKIYSKLFADFKEAVLTLVKKDSIEEYLRKEVSQRFDIALEDFLKNSNNIYKKLSEEYLRSLPLLTSPELLSINFNNLEREFDLALDQIVQGFLEHEASKINLLELLYEEKINISPYWDLIELTEESKEIGHLRYIWLEALKRKLLGELGTTRVLKIPFEPIKIKGKKIRVTTAFFTLLKTGVIDTSKANIVRLIQSAFVDANGEKLSEETIKSYLNDSREEFRSKKDLI